MANIKINGEVKDVGEAEFLSELLENMKFNAQYLAVAVNERVIPRSEHCLTKINDGDSIEVIHAVGGG